MKHSPAVLAALLLVLLPIAASATPATCPCPAATGADGAVATPPASRPVLMPLNPDVIERARARGEKIPWDRTEAALLERSGGKVNQPAGVQALSGPTVKAIVLLVRFTDDPPGGPTTRYAPAVFDSMLFGRTYVRGGADPTTDRTLRNYYAEISYGAVDIVTVNMPSSVGWVSAPNAYTYYCEADGIHDNGFGPYPRNAQGLVRDAVLAANAYVDFSAYAVGGVVQNLFVVHAGSGAEWSGDPALLWSHQWSVPSLTVDGVRVSAYSLEPECGGNTTGYGGAVTGPWLPTVGVYAHEFGHVLGLPDEYDYGYESSGTGRLSLMAGGSWNRYPNLLECYGNSPAHPSAWGVATLGFVTPVEVTGHLHGVPIPPIETTDVGSLYKLTNPGSSGQEYWLVENRQQVGFDQGLVTMGADGHGIAIYHVDENVLSRTYWLPNEAECVSGGAYAGTDNCDCASLPANPDNGEKWYGISVEQADGLYQLELGTSSGYWQDFFNAITGKTAFSDVTVPNTTSYYGCTTTVAVSNITGAAGTMTADLTASGADCTPPDADAGPDGALTCLVSSVTLAGSSATPGVTTWWTASAGGHIVSGAATLAPVVDAPGTYTLAVTDPSTGCTATDQAVVTDDTNPPTASAGADTALTCTVVSIALDGSGSSADLVYLWTTSDGHIVSGADSTVAVVDAPGTYALAVTDTASGCAAADTVLVADGTTPPDVNAGPDKALIGYTATVTLEGASATAGATFAWTTEDGHIVSGADTSGPVVDAPGAYVLTVTDPASACQAGDTTLVTQDLTGVPSASPPDAYALRPNVPNPFNPTTTIAFDLAGRQHVRLLIYDVAGKAVRSLVDGELSAGTYQVVWNGRTDGGRQAPSGVYFCRMQAGPYRETRRMTLIK